MSDKAATKNGRQLKDFKSGLWRATAIVLAIVTAGLLTSLIVVLAIGDETDSLATVALALAVMAFLAQLLIFVAQWWSGSELNRSTDHLLTDLQAAVANVETFVGERYEYVLRHALERQAEEVAQTEDASTLGETDAARIARDVVDEALREIQSGPRSSRHRSEPLLQAPAGQPSAEDQAVLEQLLRHPSREEAEKLRAELNKLSPKARSILSNYVDKEIRDRSRGRKPGLRFRNPSRARDQLLTEGLLEMAVMPPERAATSGPPYIGYARLTEKGRELGRLLLAEDRERED